jgi:hypothetical protein
LESVELCKGIVQQLRVEPQRQSNLQVTFVGTTRAIAEEHGLDGKAAVPVDEVAAGRLVKAAVQQDGTLKNLPARSALPMAPFDAVDDAEPKRPLLRCEALPCGDGEVLLAVQFVEPGDPAQGREAKPIGRRDVLHLKAGTGVLLRAPAAAGDAKQPVTVAWVRFAGFVQPQNSPRDTRGDRGDRGDGG